MGGLPMAGARAQRERDSKKTLKGQHHAWRPRAQRIDELTSACVRGLEGARVSPRTQAGTKSAWVGGLAMAGTHARTESVN